MMMWTWGDDRRGIRSTIEVNGQSNSKRKSTEFLGQRSNEFKGKESQQKSLSQRSKEFKGDSQTSSENDTFSMEAR